ncbi:enoyl-CoA hydratase/isomerase family protein [Sinomonas sp. R1AF57]|uniref:enoyl-CoA hydratase/isomerase family protein n=1 Tax=Sinomonas sp. R1AF57 TaxID=2020377 RepID=UPI000B60701B|nr:enoyl-CoA hydratase-related protein [Sinomonas sp. R1AF57]ASN53154.1 enoyl-CoA hydratase [Sinomonas sp. R1AF57]
MDSSTFDPGSYTTLKLDLDEGILTLTVDRPDALNALSQQVVSELWKAFTAIQDSCTHDAGWPVRGVIVTGGGGKAFVAGADIREMASMDPDSAAEYARSMQGVTLLIEKLPVPVIAAVDGFALGGGCELALACDFIYASESAQFGQPEVNLGLVPGFGGSVRLPQRVGLGPARELIYTARRIDAAEALRLGLANRVLPSREELLGAARDTLQEIAGKAPAAVGLAKQSIAGATGRPTIQGLETEAEAFREAFTTDDMREGTTAFLEKRKAAFTGK